MVSYLQRLPVYCLTKAEVGPTTHIATSAESTTTLEATSAERRLRAIRSTLTINSVQP